MPFSGAFSAAASFFYAVSTLLGGARNNAAVQETFVQNFESTPTHFIPISRNNGSNIGVTSFPTYYPNNGASFRNEIQFDPPPLSSESNMYTTSDNYRMNFPPTHVFDVIIPRFRANYTNAVETPVEINYYDGQTISTLFTDDLGNVTDCVVTEVNQPEEAREALLKLAREQKVIEKTNFKTMLDIITACQALEEYKHGVPMASNPFYASFDSPNEFIEAKKINIRSLVSGILPGTKWCGLGDMATSYNDLGREKNVDRCCRAHDLCPTKIKAFRSRYGLVNWSLYTKSHCECDELLYQCLKKDNSQIAQLMGNFYFNILRVQCVDNKEPLTCAARDDSNFCYDWQGEDGEDQRLMFKDVMRPF